MHRSDDDPKAIPKSRAETVPKPETRGPESIAQLFWVFNALALQGFGGVIAVAQRILVDQKKWLTAQDFVERLSLAQLLPGPNVCNLALMIGDRYFGLRGALAALAGMMAVPMVIVLTLASGYALIEPWAITARVLNGVTAVVAGMLIGSAYRLLASLRHNPLGLGFAGLIAVSVFVSIAWLRLPLAPVLIIAGGVGWGLAYRRIRRAAQTR